MKPNPKKILIILVCCLIIGGFLFLQHTLSANILQERSSIENLAREEASLKGIIAQKYALLDAYRLVLNKIEEYHFEFPKDNVSFFATIGKIMTGNKLKIIKVNPIDKPSNPDRTGVLVTCEGDYYNLLNALAEMRLNRLVVRLSSLRVAGEDGKLVSADMSIETIMRGE